MEPEIPETIGLSETFATYTRSYTPQTTDAPERQASLWRQLEFPKVKGTSPARLVAITYTPKLERKVAMAKVTLSPLITDIRGKVGSSVFSKWKGINTVRGLVTPGNPRTILQKIARGFTYASSKAWARQSDDFKREFNEAASGSGYSGNNLYVQRLQAFNPRFRDFVTTLSAAAAVGDFTLTVTADEPLTSPDYVDSLGIVEGARILIGADPALYDVTAVDRDTGTLTLQQPLAVAAAAGADVMVAGVTAPSGAAWTYRS